MRAISGSLLAGLKLFMSPRSQRLSSAAAHYPRRAVLYELAGMAYGPFAYLKSSWGSRRSP